MKNNQFNKIISHLIKNRCDRCDGVTKIIKYIKNNVLDNIKFVTPFQKQGVTGVTKLISVTPVTPQKNVGVTIKVKQKIFKSNALCLPSHLPHLSHQKMINNRKNLINYKYRGKKLCN